MPSPITRRLAEEAFAWADALPPPDAVEAVALAAAAGRVAAETLLADTDMPPQACAATDGYALRAFHTVGAGDYNPLPFTLRDLLAGRGDAVPVRAGDPLPAGADAVLPVELAARHGTALEVADTVATGDGVARAGEEWRAGEVLIAVGRVLRPQDVARAALAGARTLPVWRRPRVRVLLAGRYRHDADGAMLAGLVARDGGELLETAPAPDASTLMDALRSPGADLILVAGATGDGADDHAAASLAGAGRLELHRVAIHPGGNAALGRVGGTPVLLLPGTPLACLAAYDLLAARVLRRLARLPGAWPYRTRSLPLAGKLSSAIGRLDLCRVRIGERGAEPLAVADGRILATAARADGFVVVPPDSEGYGRGTEVVVHLYE